MKRIRTFLILTLFLVSMTGSAFAAGANTEQQTAASYLREAGIMVGNETGDMMLDQGLTRAQMAAVLTRIVTNPDHVEADSAYYRGQCKFTDVPDWAKVYVGYCAANHLVAGYGNGLYGSYDPVTPAAACTVMLRCLGDVGVEWSYATACQTAVELELAPAEALAGTEITRGNMAVLIYRTMAKMGYDIEVSVRRYDANMFASGPLPELPEPTCDWSLLPQPELPDAEVRHFTTGDSEYMFIRNLYETRRMLYTLYNAIGDNPETWQDGKPVLHPSGNPKVRINLTIADDTQAECFWPWCESEIVAPFNSSPCGTHSLEAWDVYKDGVFLQTEYLVHHTV